MMPTVHDLTQLEFPAAKALVRKHLTEFPNTRNSDKELMWRIWVKHQKLLIQDLEDFFKGLSAETITRARREIQNDEGVLLPTLAGVLVRRRIKESAIKDYYGEGSKEFQTWLGHKYDVVESSGNQKEGMGGLMQ